MYSNLIFHTRTRLKSTPYPLQFFPLNSTMAMASSTILMTPLVQPSLYCLSGSLKQNHSILLQSSKQTLLRLTGTKFKTRLATPTCFFNARKDSNPNKIEDEVFDFDSL